jgi:hypothetical protein
MAGKLFNINYVSSQVFSGGAYWTISTAPTDDRMLANKKYVDDQIAAGGVTLESILDDFYPSTLGKLVSSAADIGYRLALESGTKYSTNYDWYNTNNAQLTNWLASGEKLSKWFVISAGAYADLYASGEKFYKAYQSGTKAVPDASLGTGILTRTAAFTYGSVTDNSAQWNAIATSGEIYSKWNRISGGAYADLYASGEKFYKAYQSGTKAVPDASLSVGLVNRTAAFTYTAVTDNSAQWNAIAGSGNEYSTHLADTSIHTYSPSHQTRYGWATAADTGTIPHTCTARPTWVGLSPSGASPFIYSFKVDDTNITVYHTSPDTECFSWQAVV